jgi:uncharacterized protein YndB with AHSA1/START domain
MVPAVSSTQFARGFPRDEAEPLKNFLDGYISYRRNKQGNRWRVPMPDIMHLIRLEAAPSIVFDAISTADGVRRWWTDDADLESRIGGRGVMRFYGGLKVTELRVDEFFAPHKLVWNVTRSFRAEWAGSRISFEIDADGAATKLLFAHRGFPEPDENYALCTTGWGIYLGRLKAVIEAQPSV